MLAQRAVFSLGLAALVATAAAWFVTSSPDDVQAVSGKVLPDLSASLDKVTGIGINRAGGGYRLSRQDAVWVMEDFDGFPADQQLVRSLLNSLSRMEYQERKTSNPARHDRLDLQDPAMADSASTGITLSDSTDAPLAALIFGKVTRPAEGSRAARIYMRHKGDDQAWLASASAILPDDAMGWIDLAALKMARDDVRLARLVHSDGENVTVTRTTREDSDFVLQNIPQGFQVKSDFIANGLGSAMAWPGLEAPARLPDSFETLTDGYFESFDGLALSFAVIRGDKGKTGITFTATLLPNASEASQQQADAINSLSDGWMFTLADHKIEDLSRRMDYYIESLSSEAAEEAQ